MTLGPRSAPQHPGPSQKWGSPHLAALPLRRTGAWRESNREAVVRVARAVRAVRAVREVRAVRAVRAGCATHAHAHAHIDAHKNMEGDRGGAYGAGGPTYYARTPTKQPRGSGIFVPRTTSSAASDVVGERTGVGAAAGAGDATGANGANGAGGQGGVLGGGGSGGDSLVNIINGATDGSAPVVGWSVLDCSSNTLRNLSPALFSYTFLTGLKLNGNQLVTLPSAIGRLKALTMLDLTNNRLRSLTMEIGLCHRLRKLLLFNNQLQSLPWEMGMLYQLEQLGLEGNPMVDPLNTLKDEGTMAVIHYLRDNAPCASLAVPVGSWARAAVLPRSCFRPFSALPFAPYPHRHGRAD